MPQTAASELDDLAREGRELASKRPNSSITLDEIDGGIETEASCHAWYVKTSKWIQHQFPNDPQALADFRRLNVQRSWQNMLGSEFRKVKFLKPDMLNMVAHLEGLKPGLDEAESAHTDWPLSRLHPEIRAVAGGLYEDGYYAQAIFEAFKKVELAVKARDPGAPHGGRGLMAHAFDKDRPIIRLNSLKDTIDEDEQEGFRLVFMGVSQGIRNPKAHAQVAQTDPDRTFEYLCLASLLMRRLDDADALRG